MVSAAIDEIQQIPLIHEIYVHERHLLNTIDGEWFEILHHFPWQDYRQFGANYYNGDDRSSKRGNASFQAYLDKTLISYQLLIRHLH